MGATCARRAEAGENMELKEMTGDRVDALYTPKG